MGILKFIRPIDEFEYVSSPYGPRKDPFTGRQKIHYGTDFKTEGVGKKVNAGEGGVVIRTAESKVTGNTIIINHTPKAGKKDEHLYSLYMHLRKDKPYLTSKGKRVKQGDPIGWSGNTGKSSGPHLHFAIVHSMDRLVWNTSTGGTGIDPNCNNYFEDPAMYIGKEFEIDGTIYDLSEEEHKKVTESLDVKMHLDFINYSWYGDVYLNKKKVGRIDKDNLDLMAGLSLAELDEIMKTTSFPERGSVVI